MKVGEMSLGCLFVALLIGALVLVPVGVWGARVFFAEEIGRGNAEIQIESANSRVPRYERFYDVCVSVQNAEAAIDAETKRLDQTTDANERHRILQNISANEMARANGINEYNSLSGQYYTNDRFQGYNLPDRLSMEPYDVGGEKTLCAR
jgi:hypothetical protein